MRVLWLSPSDMLTEWMIGSLDSVRGHQREICRYDKLGVPPDRFMLDRADQARPDVILYISQAGGPFCAAPSTFQRLRKIAPIVHLCFDAADIGWDALLAIYREKQCFDLTVACDGAARGPVDLVLFHPVDPRPYANPPPLADRPIDVGTCGGFPYGLRKEVVDHLVRTVGLVIKPREEVYGSYQRYADFYKSCKIVVDCALSAGGTDGKGPYARTLKTRAIEVGLAGAALVEIRGCALQHWAVEDVAYASYETPEEAEREIRNLLAYPARAQVMATVLHDTVRRTMSPEIFWQTVFAALAPR